MDIPEIRALIAEHMELSTLCAAALISRSWRDTCMPRIWKNISWTAQIKKRPTPEAILANAHLLRAVTIYTMKLDVLSSSGGGGGGNGEDAEEGAGGEGGEEAGVQVGESPAMGTGTGTDTLVEAVAEKDTSAGNPGAGDGEGASTLESGKAEAGITSKRRGGEGGRFPFASCRRIEELELQLHIGQNQLWDHLTDLVRNNPGLRSFSVFLSGVPPPLEFMQALARTNTPSPLPSSSLTTTYTSPSSLHESGTGEGGLRTFMTSFLSLNKQTTEILLDLTTQLTSLQLIGATTVDPGSLDRWPVFPNLVTLKLSLTSGITPHHQLQIIQRCPRLQSLAWDLEESAAAGPSMYFGYPPDPAPDPVLSPDTTGYYNYRFPTAAVCQLFEPARCPQLEKLSITYPALSDQELARVVEACPRLTSFEVTETDFGVRAFHAMTRHFVHLTRLDFRRCPGVTSPMVQQMLTTCRRLVYFCADALHARDIVGLQLQQPQNVMVGGTEATQPLQEQQLQPQEWVCTDLTWLTLYICGLENAPPTWLPIVLTQLARLTSLYSLTITLTSPGLDGTKDGLPLSLTSGLSTLSSLVNLQFFCFNDLAQEMTEEDVQWMVNSWPRLRLVEGVVHPERERRMALEPIMRRKGIEVCGYFEDDEEDMLDDITSEDEDGEGLDITGLEIFQNDLALMDGGAEDQPVEGTHPPPSPPAPPPPPPPQEDMDQA